MEAKRSSPSKDTPLLSSGDRSPSTASDRDRYQYSPLTAGGVGGASGAQRSLTYGDRVLGGGGSSARRGVFYGAGGRGGDTAEEDLFPSSAFPSSQPTTYTDRSPYPQRAGVAGGSIPEEGRAEAEEVTSPETKKPGGPLRSLFKTVLFGTLVFSLGVVGYLVYEREIRGKEVEPGEVIEGVTSTVGQTVLSAAAAPVKSVVRRARRTFRGSEAEGTDVEDGVDEDDLAENHAVYDGRRTVSQTLRGN